MQAMVASILIGSVTKVGAIRPLVVIGKGAAISGAEAGLQQFISKSGIPFLATNMGRGVVPDSHQGNCNAARSSALAGADVAIIFGARLNWQLHFGEPPKWSSSVKFILVDVDPSWRDSRKAAQVLKGDAQAVASQLLQALGSASLSSEALQWASDLHKKAAGNKAKLEKRLEPTAYPLDFSTALRVVRDALSAVSPAPVVVSEGANTMDNARVILEPVEEARLRMDAGTWGTMGVGLGCAVGAAATRPDRLVVAVEGDSAFGFSGMEIETIVRYKLPIVIIIMNNSGIYGGDRRQPELQAAAAKGMKAGNFGSDPEPTAFVPSARYDKMMEAFGGESYITASASQLAAACRISFSARRPALINCIIDPMAGVESGNVHSFNAPQAKL
ncbi:hypothetical protein WJX84_011991 [Apatococcus fuscideae]|uniref:2-hydroxyacyl-CoA lyase n=1 Tax=Apatococcus fuscideae TaxID=2026836 RepID=A0AAW1T004_9CHLO